MGDASEAEQEAGDTAVPSVRKRERSQIEFPYTDLERSVDLCRTLHGEGGQARIEQTQLAVAMDQSASGGTFRGRLGAAKMFGLIGTEMGKVWLEPLGLRIIDEATAAAAKAEAFLNVPLYREMFERYKGYALPPVAAIERQMEALGVPPKQKERARQAFSASATYANYIAPNGRFSKPSLVGVASPPPEDRPDDKPDRGGGGGGGGSDGGDEMPGLHPFIKGLLSELPPAKTKWPVDKRSDWLNAAAMMFKLIYEGDGDLTITATNKTPTNNGD